MHKEFNLQNIARVCRAELIGDRTDLVIQKVRTDSRKDLTEGLFVAIVGPNNDGHDYLDQALENGAWALLISEKDLVPRYRDKAALLVVDDTTVALGHIARYYRDLTRAQVIAVSGSVGKTSTRDFIAAALSPFTAVHKTKGNLNNRYGLAYSLLDMPEHTPWAVIELGIEGKGDMKDLSYKAHPDLAVLTNIGTSHMEHFENRKDLAEEKRAILSDAKAGAPLFINADDPYLLHIALKEKVNRPVYLVHMKGQGKYLRTELEEDSTLDPAEWKQQEELSRILASYDGPYTYGTFKSGTEFYAENIRKTGHGQSFDFYIKEAGQAEETKVSTVSLKQVSLSNCQNALFGLALTLVLGHDLKPAVEALADLKLTSGRQEEVRLSGGNLLINDAYNASPESMKSAFELLDVLSREGDYEGTLAILGGVNELGPLAPALHLDIGRALGRVKPDRTWLVGPWGQTLARGLEETDPDASYKLFEDTEALLNFIEKEAFCRQLILVKASRTYHLDDVCRILLERGEDLCQA